jgi:alpha-galactosidase
LYPYWSGWISIGYVMGLAASTGADTLSDNFSDITGLRVGTYSWKECYTNATGAGTSVSATPAAYEMVIFKIAES